MKLSELIERLQARLDDSDLPVLIQNNDGQYEHIYEITLVIHADIGPLLVISTGITEED